ncbi:hypothetical protein QBZ16_004488 [Prototheca wickerhamii]|uniref:SCP domain-containing protein n=1 Tax=Prototheca wickerhamii TaxID=3111 RepID=A0AAD9MI05_PROWI|nr:hypothetical protein QBZ16_004488 [Prototheca wickerhamii]
MTKNIRVTCRHVWLAFYYNEAAHYVDGTPGDTGHFTQMVWNRSRELGCGFAVCPGSTSNPNGYGTWNYLVCRFYPVGNVIGYYDQNVFPSTVSPPPPPYTPPRSSSSSSVRVTKNVSVSTTITVNGATTTNTTVVERG